MFIHTTPKKKKKKKSNQKNIKSLIPNSNEIIAFS
jgi:hypothetical protein